MLSVVIVPLLLLVVVYEVHCVTRQCMQVHSLCNGAM